MKQASLFSFFKAPAGSTAEPVDKAKGAKDGLSAEGIAAAAALKPTGSAAEPVAQAKNAAKSTAKGAAKGPAKAIGKENDTAALKEAPTPLKEAPTPEGIAATALKPTHQSSSSSHYLNQVEQSPPPARLDHSIAAEGAAAPTQQTLRAELVRTSEPLPSTGGQLSAFERLRLENIRRNQAFLSSLGLDDVKPTVVSAGAGPAAKKAKRQRPVEQPISEGPTRRSARVASAPPVLYDGTSADLAGDGGEEEEEEEEEGEPEDSAVLRYVMGCGPAAIGGTASGDVKEMRLRYPEPFKSDALKAIYSLEFHPQYPSLLLAAGKQGYASLFKLGEEGEEELLSFRAHSTWVSTATFVPSTTRAALRVLTSSDDSFVKLWDFSKCNQKQVPTLISSNRLHGRGIYSMDISADGSKVITASKDACVTYSQFTQSGDGLDTVTVYEELHSAVVKSAAWQRGNGGDSVFASGGQDRCLCVCDVRQPPGSPVVALQDAHGPSGGIHTVRWSPEGGPAPLLMSAAMGDASVRVWDMRQLGAHPLHELRGHHNPRLKPGQLKDIISPAFLGQGYVLSGGQQSDSLSLYSLETGACVSRGDIGFTAYSLGCTLDQRVAVAGRSGQLLYLQAM